MSIRHPFAHPPADGSVLPVGSGVHWLRMPLPFALDHVNLWLIEDGPGWALVDTGIPDRRSRALWEQVFAGPMGGRPLTRLIVTHFHPDHIGLASWLAERFGLALEATLGEWLFGRMLSLSGGADYDQASHSFYRAAGFDAALLEMVAQRGNAYGQRIKAIPATLLRIRQDDALVIGGRRWEVITAEGHSPEMACLHCPALELLISGDQVLPSISPNVSLWPTEPEADPLALFLASLKRFAVLPEQTLVLPSHGLPFTGLHHRLEQLARHHDERLAETLDACATPITAADLLKVLFRRPLDDHQLFFAIGESLAHLRTLVNQGKLSRIADAGGADYYERA